MVNLVLITSVIDPPNTPLSYCSKRSIFTKEERYIHTKKTIESIKKYIPNCKILLIEGSDLTFEEEKYFKENTDFFINIYNNKNLLEKICSKSKSLAEGTQTIESLKFILENNIEFDSLFKISGRYWLTDNFDYNNFKEGSVVKPINGNYNNMFTAFYKLDKKDVKNYYKYLISDSTLNCMNNCVGLEIIFANFIKTINCNYINNTGLEGFVSVCGSKYNC